MKLWLEGGGSISGLLPPLALPALAKLRPVLRMLSTGVAAAGGENAVLYGAAFAFVAVGYLRAVKRAREASLHYRKLIVQERARLAGQSAAPAVATR